MKGKPMMLARAVDFKNEADQRKTSAFDWNLADKFCSNQNDRKWFDNSGYPIFLAKDEYEAAELLAEAFLHRLRAIGVSDPLVTFKVDYIPIRGKELQIPITGQSTNRFLVTEFEVKPAAEELLPTG